MLKKLLVVLITISLLIGFTGCNKAKVSGTVKDGTLIVGFDQNFPPMGFVDDNGKFTGFDLELAAIVAERLGLKLVLQPIAWSAKDMELASKNIDCVWNGYYKRT